MKKRSKKLNKLLLWFRKRKYLISMLMTKQERTKELEELLFQKFIELDPSKTYLATVDTAHDAHELREALQDTANQLGIKLPKVVISSVEIQEKKPKRKTKKKGAGKNGRK